MRTERDRWNGIRPIVFNPRTPENSPTWGAREVLWLGLGLVCFVVVLCSCAAAQITSAPRRLQAGSPVFFRVLLQKPAVGIKATWLNHQVTFNRLGQTDVWYALAGIDVEQAPGTYLLSVTATEAGSHASHSSQSFTISPAHYNVSTLHVEQKFVAPDVTTQQLIAQDKAIKDAAFAKQTPELLWSGAFHTPVPFTATDSFGTRRMFNGQLASIHKGTDFHAPSGTPVKAANDGIVLIAHPMFYEGNLVVIDHGGQFDTLYMHLSKIEVKAGDHVHTGQQLGLSGATGRVTGPHLHFAARWQGMYVDPVLLLGLKLPPR